MDANKILNADILDIVFEGKNKEYGAYNLRKTYNKRLTMAFLITIGTVLLILLINFLAGAFHKDDTQQVVISEVTLSQVKEEKPPPPLPPKAVLPPPPPKAETIKFTPPVIKKDEEVPKDVKPPDVKTVEATTIAATTQQGVKDPTIVAPPVTDPGTSVVAAPVDDNQIFTKVEKEAEFPGGPAKWIKYLQNNLDGSTPLDNGAAPGTYTVMVQFVVGKDGTISDVHALTHNGFGMEAEAVKVIENGPKWIPALQNGHNVNAYHNQPITFLLQDGD